MKLEKVSPISDIQIAIERMLKIVKEQGKRVLITIDDITKSKDVIGFAIAFQDWISKGLPIFLLMTGLYENVYSLQTDSRCSFLMRAERILLMPLNMIGMKNQYKQTFQCTDEEALEMADFTKGYSYAFQVLGYIMWEAECSLEEAIPRFDERMSGYCYEKIWDDLSEKEKVIISLLASNGKMRTRDVIDKAELSEKTYSVIRDRLVKKGLVDGREYGFIKLLLPRFEEYVKTVY